MPTPSSRLVLLYLLFVVTKLFLLFLVPSPTIFGDEYAYAKLARSFAFEHTFHIHGVGSANAPPLYPILLAPAYLFTDMDLVYRLMQGINAFLSTLILFPAYLLLHAFLDRKKALLGAALTALLPLSFSTTPYLMSENLFHTLFLFALYFLFQLLTTPKRYSVLLTGITISLTILTRYLGLVLLLLVGVLFLTALWQRQRQTAKHLLLAGGLSILLLLPWVLTTLASSKNILTLTQSTLFQASITQSLPSLTSVFLAWTFIHLSYLLLALFFFPAFFIFSLWKNQPQRTRTRLLLFITCILTLLLVLLLSHRAAHAQATHDVFSFPFPGRLIGRYLDILLPLLLLTSIIGAALTKPRKHSRLLLGFGIILLLGSALFTYSLFSYNNLSLTLYGVIKTGINSLLTGTLTFGTIPLPTLLIMLGLLFLTLSLFSHISRKPWFSFSHFILFLTGFFFLTNALALSISAYNARQWDRDEQLQLSHFLQEHQNNFHRLLIDENACTSRILRGNPASLCTPTKSTTLVGFWVNKEIRITSAQNVQPGDYFVTRNQFNGSIVTETANGIKVYKHS